MLSRLKSMNHVKDLKPCISAQRCERFVQYTRTTRPYAVYYNTSEFFKNKNYKVEYITRIVYLY